MKLANAVAAYFLASMSAMIALLILPLGSYAQEQPSPKGIMVTSVGWTSGLPPQIDEIMASTTQSLNGRDVQPKELANLFAEATERIQKAGYVIGQVGITTADFEKLQRTGALHLTVLPGKIQSVIVNNSSRVNDERLRETAVRAVCPDGFGDDCILTAERMERMALILQDLPGVKLQPPALNPKDASLGMTHLEVTTEKDPDRRMIAGNVIADNFGYPASGEYRFGANLLMANLFGFGDIITAGVNISNQAAVVGSIGFSSPLGHDGWRWQASYAHSLYTLPQTNTSGSADSVRLGVTYPWIRGLDGNWNVSLDAGFTQSRQLINGLVAFEPRNLYSLNLTVAGNSGDRAMFLNSDYWAAMAVLTTGQVAQVIGGYDSTGVLGHYDKLRIDAVTKRNLGKSGFYLLASVRGQVPDSNLDGSEKMSIGGPGGVRAYRVDEGGLDLGILTSFELRRVFEFGDGNRVAPGIFVDILGGGYNLLPYDNWQVNSGYNDPTLPNFRSWQAAGIGLDFTSRLGITAALSWAIALPASPNSVNHPGSTNHFWATIGFRF